MKIWELKEQLIQQMWTGAGNRQIRILSIDGTLLDVQRVFYDADDDQFYLVAADVSS